MLASLQPIKGQRAKTENGHLLHKGSITYEQCDQKKSPNVYKSCLKMISLEK